MCLYGNDLDEDTTPVEAGLTWVIGRSGFFLLFPFAVDSYAGKLTRTATTGKDRRETGNFIGAEEVRKHLKDGPPRRRVGLIVEGAPARRMFSPVSFRPCIQ